MNVSALVLASLRHHRRVHLGALLGATLGAAVLVGALIVGDSVRASLQRQALARIGGVHEVLAAEDRLFEDSLGARLGGDNAIVLQVRGVASADGGARRANDVQVLGIEPDFFGLGPDGSAVPAGGFPERRGEALINARLARQLGVDVGDEILVRIERPSGLPRDMVLATSEDASLGLRVRIRDLVGEQDFGRFSLGASQVAANSVFLPLDELQAELELGARANLLLTGSAREGKIEEVWTLADAQLAIRTLGEGAVELQSDRVFLDGPVIDALAATDLPLTRVLTYFVNAIEHGSRSTPYSMVTAIEGAGEPWGELLPRGDASAIAINRWLADDLEAAVGDEVSLRYFVIDEGGELVERSRAFRVHAIVPLEGAFADDTLMPDFPGLADADHCREWEPGVMVDLDAIHDEDEAYWDDHRGTPKAFVHLAAGQGMWGSRFGDLTAVRTAAEHADALSAALRENLDPASVGLFLRDVRTPALASAAPSVDFGGLFLGLSFFLILAAILLTALIFSLGVDQRASELGALLAMGFTPGRVRGLLLREAALVATAGGALGAGFGTLYARAVLRGLGSLWEGAVASAEITYHASWGTLVLGAVASAMSAIGAILLTVRRTLTRSAPELLAARAGVMASSTPVPGKRRGRIFDALGGLAVLAAAALGLLGPADGAAAAGAFFGAGALLLVAALAGARHVLARVDGVGGRSLFALGLRSAARRPARSLATVATLASGVFLVVAVQANRLGPVRNAGERASGTGGFELFGSSSLPMLDELESYPIDPDELLDVDLLAFRVRDGDDASCLNLGTPAQPRLVGVPSAALAQRQAFSFARALEDVPSAWTLLEGDADGAIPAIGDQASVQWTMKKGLGETLAYVDERGRAFDVRIVATLSDSILQGDLLIDERHFQERFPSESGRRMFLIDAPPERADEVAAAIGRGLRDLGLEVTPTARRLEEFHAVQNTYLAIFQALGALGLLLGSAGLALVVLRNAYERRGELALLRALGFAPRALRVLVMSEHGLTLALGMAAGAIPALIAVLPAVRGSGGELSLAPLIGIVVLVGSTGLFWAWLATWAASRGGLVEALRND